MKSSIQKVLFVHDGPLYRDEEGSYYGTSFTDEVVERYLGLGTEVSFLIRVKFKEKAICNNLSKISNERFSVIEVPDFKSFIRYFKLFPKTKVIVENAVRQADVIVARLPSGTGRLAVEYAQKYKKPLLAEMVACTKDTYWYHSLKGKMIAHYSFFKQRKLMAKVNYCIYVTEKFLQDRYPIKGKMISCSNVNITNNNEQILVTRLLKIKQMKQGMPLTIGSVGKLSMRLKGYSDVISAICSLKTRGIIFNYRLVGGGDTLYLKKLIKKLKLEKQVTILGPLAHSEVLKFMDEIDLYIQPSRTEGLPRAMIEAMSRACPALGSDVGGIPELTRSENTFQSGNIAQIENCLLHFDQSKLIREANRSFNTASQYREEFLTMKRKSFYSTFLKDHKLKIHG